jgi:hypothetical protein
VQLGPDRVDAAIEPRASADAARRRTPPADATVRPLSPARYKVEFTASAALRDKLARLQALLGEDLDAVIDAAVTEKLARVEAKRFGLTKTPRKARAAADLSRRSRYLPAAVRRLVRIRDGDRCTFVLRSGARCPERRWLEFHHRAPYARGGAHDPENVCLMCRAHNAHAAEVDYGADTMARHRRRSDRVSEDAPYWVRRAPGNSHPGWMIERATT